MNIKLSRFFLRAGEELKRFLIRICYEVMIIKQHLHLVWELSAKKIGNEICRMLCNALIDPHFDNTLALKPYVEKTEKKCWLSKIDGYDFT